LICWTVSSPEFARVPPFNNKLARQAVNLATDRNELVRLISGPVLTSPTCQLLPPNFPGYHLLPIRRPRLHWPPDPT